MSALTDWIIQNKKTCSDFIQSEIKHICTSMPKRGPASEGERAAAEYLAERMRVDCGCDDVWVEPYETHPGAFYGWLYITNLLYLIAIGLYRVQPLISVILIVAAYIVDVLEFQFYRQFVDRLFPKATGANVTAIRHASETCKRRILFNGHLDAAWEWPANYRFGGIVFEILALIPTAGALYYLFLSLSSALNGKPYMFWWYGGLFFVPFMIYICFIRDRNRIVDGANDNLTGCYMGISLLKAMHEQGIQLQNTEVGVLLTGSEEAGLRGAKAWAQKHKEQLRDVPTYIISFDTIHDPKYLGVNYKDLNGFVKSDGKLADLFMEAAKNQNIPCIKTLVPFMGGATDSAAFTQAGIRAVGITALNHKLERYYHTRKDTWDNLNEEGIQHCLIAAAEFLTLADEGKAD